MRASLAVLLLPFALAACPDGDDGKDDTDESDAPGESDTEPTEPTFADVQAVFTRSCALAGCHDSPGEFQTGLDLSEGHAYAMIVDVPSVLAAPLDRVEPGDPDASFLWHKIEGTQESVGDTFGEVMPPAIGNRPTLPAEDRAVIEAWILAGAPE